MFKKIRLNRYRRKRPKVDAKIFDSALSHTRRLDASEIRVENDVSTFGRFRLWTSPESSPVSVKPMLARGLFFRRYFMTRFYIYKNKGRLERIGWGGWRPIDKVRDWRLTLQRYHVVQISPELQTKLFKKRPHLLFSKIRRPHMIQLWKITKIYINNNDRRQGFYFVIYINFITSYA